MYTNKYLRYGKIAQPEAPVLLSFRKRKSEVFSVWGFWPSEHSVHRPFYGGQPIAEVGVERRFSAHVADITKSNQILGYVTKLQEAVQRCNL